MTCEGGGGDNYWGPLPLPSPVINIGGGGVGNVPSFPFTGCEWETQRICHARYAVEHSSPFENVR